MPLDYCPSGKATKEELKRSVDITINWAKRSKKYFDNKTRELKNLRTKEQINVIASGAKQSNNNITIQQYNNKRAKPALFGIIQGGLDPELRRYCASEIIKLNFDGYAVGGLAVDLETQNMWKVVKLAGKILPEDKPRYLMGVGTPDDIIKATKLGMDMYDCILPTRLARHGSVYLKTEELKSERTKEQRKVIARSKATKQSNNNLAIQQFNNYKLINLLKSKYRSDGGVIDKDCRCPVCAGGFSKAYISHLVREKEMLGPRLATLHNLYLYLELLKEFGKS